MEKGVVRESKFRHIFGKPWKKEACITNMKVSTSAGLNVVQGNDIYIAVPWSTSSGGAVALVPLEQRGKVPDRYPLIDAHPSSILDFRFHNTRSDLLGTCARESTVKIWKIPEDGIKETMREPLAALEAHTGRVTSLAFHPCADNVLLSVGSDRMAHIWDIEATAPAISIEGPQDVVQSVVWNRNGTLFATTCTKDKTMRVYDPRSGAAPVHQAHGHDGGKGFHCVFLENDRLVSVGFSKSSGRQIAMWDFTGTEPRLGMTELDVNPGILTPSYDFGTGVCTLTGRGDEIFFFELNNEAPFVHTLAKSKCSSYNGSCTIPTRCCDVKQSEVARLLNASKTGIEPVSIIVPRKNAKTVFQEDIFPAAPSGEAGLSASEWLGGANADVPLRSLQPKGMPSVFSLSAEQGGKSIELERRRTSRRTSTVDAIETKAVMEASKFAHVSEGVVLHYVGGWWNPWTQRWLAIGGKGAATVLNVFESSESARAVATVMAKDMESVEIDEYDDCQFRVSMKTGKEHVFKAGESAEATGWQFSITQAMERAQFSTQHGEGAARSFSSAPAAAALAPAAASSSRAATSASASTSEEGEGAGLEGHLEIFEQGGWFSFAGWSKRYWRVQDMVLYAYRTSDEHESPIENFHLDRVTSVTPSEHGGSDKECTFKICTPTQVIHLAAESDDDRERWVVALTKLVLGEDEDVPVDMTVSGPCEAYVEKQRRGLLYLTTAWDRRWMSAAKKDVYYYKSHKDCKAPVERLSLQLVRKVVSSEKSDEEFELHMQDRQVHVHRAEDEEERDRIVSHLNFLRQQFLNLFETFQITDEDIAKARNKPTAGYNIVDPSAVKRGEQPLLIEVRGRRRLHTFKVKLDIASLCPTSVFILDCGKRIYQWNGAEAPRVAKGKGLDVCSKIRQKERGGTVDHIVLDQGKANENNDAFWRVLKGQPSDVRSAATSSSPSRVVTRLYRVLDKDVEECSRVKLIYEGALPQCELLSTKACVVVDCHNEAFVWVGKDSSSYQRKLALAIAKKVIKEEDRAEWATITREVEHGETICFKEKFSNFAGMLPINLQKKEGRKNIATAKQQERVDVLVKMHNAQRPCPMMYDDGSGTVVMMWRVEDFEKFDVAREDFGAFYDHESYIIHYQYMHKNKEANLVYFWQGAFSSRNEKGTSAYMTVDVSGDLAEAEQVRVEQGKEGKHFLTVFEKLGFHVRRGKRQGALASPCTLYRVLDRPVPYAVEVPCSSEQMNSLASFVARTSDSILVWHGKGASSEIQQAAGKFASQQEGPVVELKEGSESNEWWDALGGKKEYFRVHDAQDCHAVRMFSVSSASGVLAVEEVYDYTQEDLHDGHIAIVDAFVAIYVWIGSKAPTSERKAVVAIVQDYVKQSPRGHDRNVPVWTVEAFHEPMEFKSQFACWSTSRFPRAKRGLKEEKRPFEELVDMFTERTYTFAELKREPLPRGVDPTKLETYLSDSEFEEVFAMDRAAFKKLSMWKVEKLKQEVGLF